MRWNNRLEELFGEQHWRFWLFLICLLGLVLRLIQLEAKGLWFDELHSIIPTAPGNSIYSVIEYAKSDQPPLFFLSLHGWFQIFPYDEFYGKLLCVLFGVLGIPAVYFLGEELGGRKVGLTGAAMTAPNIFHIYYSQELRFYSLLFLLACLSCLFFARIFRNPSRYNWFMFLILSVSILYTHYFGLVVVVAEAILFVILTIWLRRGWLFFVKGMICAVLTLFAFIPWLPNILHDSEVNSFWIPPLDWYTLPDYFSRYFNGWWGLAMKVYFSWVLFAVFAIGIWALGKRITDKLQVITPTIVLGWILLTLAIPMIYSVVKIPLFLDRYTMITLPAIIVTIAFGWNTIRPLAIRVFLLLVFIFFTWRADHRYFYAFKKPEYRELVRTVIEKNTDKLPVLSNTVAWHCNYYFRAFHAGYEVIDSRNMDFMNLSREFSRIWILNPRNDLSDAQRAILESKYVKTTEIELEEVHAALFVAMPNSPGSTGINN
ncbi:MAG TPA: glycosyltransferase family 39 protein [Cyclobacteriaceae bacterium]|nr:glycosyltransferase family 39 protein [Cyclobacteriaceae bacterium]